MSDAPVRRSLLRVSPERRRIVLRDVEAGSVPTPVYYVLLALSEVIAGFGLLTDSATTIIGANVVAPLMMPIFGCALGLVRGDLRLLRIALVAEFGGAALGVAVTYLLGLLPLVQHETTALLAQTRPTLVDLVVAAAAGLAGFLAMVDERMSPALPGVAIATALNPPIAAIGICLAFGAYDGAWGAFLLFFANVLAILAVGGVVFVVAGFVRREEFGTLGDVARRFAAAAIGLVVVTGLLTSYLVAAVRNERTVRAVSRVVDAELAQDPNTSLEQIDVSRGDDRLSVLAVVRAPRVLPPPRVKAIEDALRTTLDEPVQLFLRIAMTRDVTATGATNLLPHRGLDGALVRTELTPDVALLQQGEQVIRELLADRPDITLNDVSMLRLSTGPVLVASIESAREPRPERIGQAEDAIRARVGDPALRLVVRAVSSTDTTRKGRILFGEAHLTAADLAGLPGQTAVETAVRDELQRLDGVFVVAVDAVRRGDGWAVRAATTGTRVPTPAEMRRAETRLRTATGEPVQVSAWARPEAVVDAARVGPLGGD